MTKEIKDIISAFDDAEVHSRKTALATVVHVEGSSYRRPGARMLVEDSGKLTGAISGGCLEGDALKKALLAIEQSQNKLVTYNTNYEDDAEFGIQLGCNGIVHILFEPINPLQRDNPISLLKQCCASGRDAVLVTLFSIQDYYGNQPGTCFFSDGEKVSGSLSITELETPITEEATVALGSKSSYLKQYDECVLTAFIEYIQPPIDLVIVGAGNDVLPLVEMAIILGWSITIVDGRSSHANKLRFPKAHQILVGKPAEIMKQLVVTDRSAFVLMTHNYNYDLEMIKLLSKEKSKYIGILGPKKKLERALNDLQENSILLTEDQLSRIYGPTGLDLGAETAEEIALSVLAEIKAVMEDRPGKSLRDRLIEIHARTAILHEGSADARQE